MERDHAARNQEAKATLSRRAFGTWLATAVGGGMLAPARAAQSGSRGVEPRFWLGRERGKWCWPTPNPAFVEGQPFEAYVQNTGTEFPIESGLYGCVRNSGNRFHEGIDLFPIQRDRRGEALDSVFACAAGRVVYVNEAASRSGYGRYVVVEHEDLRPRILSLYAHLRDIAPGIAAGSRVGAGDVLGGMGRSAGGYSIPRERAHLHFELAFRLSDHFEAFYLTQNHREPNHHGLFNGQNLLGFDPLAFFDGLHQGRVPGILDHVRRIPVAFVLRVAQRTAPDFLQRYPELLTTPRPRGPVRGWDIGFSGAGIPLQWTPRMERNEPTLESEGAVTVLAVDTTETAAFSCRRLLRGNEGQETPAPGLLDLLRLLFNLR